MAIPSAIVPRTSEIVQANDRGAGSQAGVGGFAGGGRHCAQSPGAVWVGPEPCRGVTVGRNGNMVAARTPMDGCGGALCRWGRPGRRVWGPACR